MKKIVAAALLSVAIVAPASAQDGPLQFGNLAANGPLIAAGVGFLTIIIVGANADSTFSTTTRN